MFANCWNWKKYWNCVKNVRINYFLGEKCVVLIKMLILFVLRIFLNIFIPFVHKFDREPLYIRLPRCIRRGLKLLSEKLTSSPFFCRFPTETWASVLVSWVWSEELQIFTLSLTVTREPVGHGKVWGVWHLEGGFKSASLFSPLCITRKVVLLHCLTRLRSDLGSVKEKFSSNEVGHESWQNTETHWKGPFDLARHNGKIWKEQSVL